MDTTSFGWRSERSWDHRTFLGNDGFSVLTHRSMPAELSTKLCNTSAHVKVFFPHREIHSGNSPFERPQESGVSAVLGEHRVHMRVICRRRRTIEDDTMIDLPHPQWNMDIYFSFTPSFLYSNISIGGKVPDFLYDQRATRISPINPG